MSSNIPFTPPCPVNSVKNMACADPNKISNGIAPLAFCPCTLSCVIVNWLTPGVNAHAMFWLNAGLLTRLTNCANPNLALTLLINA